MVEKRWLLYIILSGDNKLYTGITTDLQRRVCQHLLAKNGAKFFRGRTPKAVVYAEFHTDRSSASKAEYAVKQLPRSEKETLSKNLPENTLHYLQQLSLPIPLLLL